MIKDMRDLVVILECTIGFKICLHEMSEELFADIFGFLAPPAERQRSFSNADSSVVRRRRRLSSVVVVNFSLKMLISQKLPDNYFSFLVYSFIRKVPMFCINIDLIESS